MTSRTPLQLSSGEEKQIDDAIDYMATRVRRLGISFDRMYEINDRKSVYKEIDKVIADVFSGLRKKKIVDFAEKLFDRLGSRSLKEEDPMAEMNISHYRLMDTMEYVVAFKGAFRGEKIESRMSKADAKVQLKKRGLM